MGRILIVGDVHGCAAELGELLEAVAFGAQDRLYLVGDLVGRGPDPAGVLRLARQTGARAVLGNHELAWLRRYERAGPRSQSLRAEHSHVGAASDASGMPTAALAEEDWALLRGLPLVLDLPDECVRIVHAGVVQDVPIEQQDAWSLTNMRSFAADGTPSARLGQMPWGATYCGEMHVVYGHDARRALQIHPQATGLDTGCVYGGCLSALVLGAGQRPPRVQDRADALVQVHARAAYCQTG